MKKDDFKSKLQNLFGGQQEKKGKKLHSTFYILIGLGVVIMLFSNLLSTFQPDERGHTVKSNEDEHDEATSLAGPSTIVEYEHYYAKEIKEVLSDVVGISDISVKVNVATTEKKIFEKNQRTEKQVTEEHDQEGGTRTIDNYTTDEQLIIIKDGERDRPVIITSEKPIVKGVIVVAQGAESIQTKQQIIEAITRYLHIPSHQVSVLPKK